MRRMNTRKTAVWSIFFFICFTAAATPTDSIPLLPADTIAAEDSITTLNDSIPDIPDGGDTTFVSTDTPAPRANSWGNGLSNRWGNGLNNGWSNGLGNAWSNGLGNGWSNAWGNGWEFWGNDSLSSEPDTIYMPDDYIEAGYEFVSLPPAASIPLPHANDDIGSCAFRYVRNLPGDSMFIIRIYDETFRDTFHIPTSRETDAMLVLYSFRCSERLPRDLFSLPDSVTRPILCDGAQRPTFNITPPVNDSAIMGSKHVIKADCNFCDSIVWLKDGEVFRETELRVYKVLITGERIPLREYNMILPDFFKLRGPVDTSLILEPVIGEHAGIYRAIISNKCYRDTSEAVNLVVVDSAQTAAHKMLSDKSGEENFRVEIFPNPMAEEVHIRTKGTFTVKVFNTEGKLMTLENGFNHLWLNTADFPGGLYIAQVITDAGETRKLLVK